MAKHRRAENESAESNRDEGTQTVGSNGEALPKAKETKAQRFTRLYRQRLPKALQRLEQLENLTNASQYEATDEQWKFILSKLQAAVNRIEDGFSSTKKAPIVEEMP